MPATIEQLLAQHGLELLGHADTAFVFARPESPDDVVKVGVDVRDGWPAWAAWCATQRSPHLPVIRSCHWIYDGAGRPQLFVGLMERLQPSNALRPMLTADRALKRDPHRLADRLDARLPGVAGMVRIAAAAFPGAVWDMAPNNWMERADGTLVLNDPISRLI